MFIQPCFIRKNTPELRKKLEELGYLSPSKLWYDENFAICTVYRDNRGEYFIFKIDDDFERIIAPSYPYIDCGINENLFLSIAALRDDKPDYQWFLWEDDGIYHTELEDSWRKYIPNEKWEEWWWFEVRKAGVEELIEHFKEK